MCPPAPEGQGGVLEQLRLRRGNPNPHRVLSGLWRITEGTALRSVTQGFYLHTFELVPQKAQPHSETVPSTLDGAVSCPRNGVESRHQVPREGRGWWHPRDRRSYAAREVQGQDRLPGCRSETSPAGRGSSGSLCQVTCQEQSPELQLGNHFGSRRKKPLPPSFLPPV